MDNIKLLTDEELAVHSINDTLFFGELIDRYQSKLSKYLSRRSSATAEDIEDLLQNIFINVYKNLRDFDSSLSFSSWIYRIAHNEMIDWYRKAKRTQTFSYEENEEIIKNIASEINVAEELIEKERLKEIKDIINSLGEKYQEIIELRFFEEKSYKEIADILKIPEGTVAIRLNRVKKQLQELLKSHE